MSAEVIDGDTLRVVLLKRGPVLVRLAWVDAPDRLQAHGDAARASLNALAAQRAVRLETVSEASRLLRATVWVTPQEIPCRSASEHARSGHAQITRVLAWHDRRSLGQPAQAFGQYEHANSKPRCAESGSGPPRLRHGIGAHVEPACCILEPLPSLRPAQ